MKIPSTWQIFCPDSEPENMWIAEKRNRAGKVFNISRNFWAYLSDRYSSELENPGIYVLVGGNDGRTIYIGQSENLCKRIGEHVQDAGKSFFSRAICVTESNLNNAHFRWMEAHLIQQAKDTAHYQMMNGATPNKPRLSESDVFAAQEFLDELKQIFSIIGVSAFTTESRTESAHSSYEFSVNPQHKQTKKRANKRIDKSKSSEIKKRIQIVFSEQKNVILQKQKGGRFRDEFKTISVFLSISRYHGENSGHDYWYTINDNQVKFLRETDMGYVIFGMEEETISNRYRNR